jgi:predicted anti-sigma-YlaC factor YlaD
MSACNFEYLLEFVNNQLDPDKQLEVYDHLNRCDICRDAVYQISRDLNRALFIYCAHCAKHNVPRRQLKTARFRRAHARANVLARPTVRRSASLRQ